MVTSFVNLLLASVAHSNCILCVVARSGKFPVPRVVKAGVDARLVHKLSNLLRGEHRKTGVILHGGLDLYSALDMSVPKEQGAQQTPVQHLSLVGALFPGEGLPQQVGEEQSALSLEGVQHLQKV